MYMVKDYASPVLLQGRQKPCSIFFLAFLGTQKMAALLLAVELKTLDRN